jgi:L-histidine N-alpha-methyltransferase
VTTRVVVDVHLPADAYRAALRRDVRVGLTAEPKELPPKWFYDEAGSELFDRITRLPEYYPTRREREILEREAHAIVDESGADTLVELGSGTSEKTQLLLAAFERQGRLRRFIPFDVSEATLRAAARRVAADHPEIDVHAVVGDFEHHLGLIPREGRRMVVFLGGTIGNLVPSERKSFLAEIADGLDAGESLLLGTDLVKSPDRLVAAYDDPRGITAAFNRNVLRVINRELGADFVPEGFDHVAVWDAENEWIEMRLRSAHAQRVHVADLDLAVDFAAGEEMRTEVSAKFRREVVEAELAGAGLTLVRWWTDQNGDFALSLSVRH